MGTHSFIRSFVRSFTCDHTAIGQTKNGQDAVQREMGDEMRCDAGPAAAAAAALVVVVAEC